MKIFGKKITPVSRFLGLDVRAFFVWLEKIERWRYRKTKAARLDIHDVRHKNG